MEYLEPLTLPDYWPHGVRYPDVEAPIFVHWAAPNTVILRQSKMTSYEAPFLYLLFGQERAILFDTGAVADAAVFPLRATVDRLMTQWLAQYPRTRVYELVVAHTHAHGDHVAGDVQFGDRMNTVVVDHAPEAVASFFDIATWPGGEGRYDLGGRVLRILPIPGHHPASIAIYDPPSYP